MTSALARSFSITSLRCMLHTSIVPGLGPPRGLPEEPPVAGLPAPACIQVPLTRYGAAVHIVFVLPTQSWAKTMRFRLWPSPRRSVGVKKGPSARIFKEEEHPCPPSPCVLLLFKGLRPGF